MSQISKQQVDQFVFVPGHQVPSCKLDVEWTGQQEQSVELVHRVELIGAEELFNFFMIRNFLMQQYLVLSDKP